MSSEITVNKDRLLEIVEGFLDRYRSEDENGNVVKIPEAAAAYIANGTGKTPDAVARTLYRLIEEDPKFVKFGTADWLVATGMGRPDLLQTDLIRVNRKSGRAKLAIPPSVPTKRCPGPLCQGKPVPVTEFQFRSGERKKERRAYCRACDAVKSRPYKKAYDFRRRKHRDWRYSGYVPFSRVKFALEELCVLFGSVATAKLIGVSHDCVSRWRTDPPRNMRKEYAARILQTCLEVRNGNGFHEK